MHSHHLLTLSFLILQSEFFVKCNVTTVKSKPHLWFAGKSQPTTQPSFIRQEIRAEESEEMVQVMPHDPLSGGEEISAETVELKRRKQEKKVGNIQWHVTSKPAPITLTTLILRNQPNRGTTNTTTSTTKPKVTTKQTVKYPKEVMIMDSSELSNTTVEQDTPKPVHMTRTVRFRTWSSNYSIPDFNPENETFHGFMDDHIYSPSNKKKEISLAPNVQPLYVLPKRKKSQVLYYIPRQALQQQEARRNRYILQPVKSDEDYSSESDESTSSSSEEDYDDMPRYHPNFVPPPPKMPTTPYKPQTQTQPQQTVEPLTAQQPIEPQTQQQQQQALEPQTIQSTTPLTTQPLQTNSNTIQLTTATPVTKPNFTPVIPLTTSSAHADASHKKQHYLEHPIAYLMGHLPSSTLPAAPTHPADFNIAASVVNDGLKKNVTTSFVAINTLSSETGSTTPQSTLRLTHSPIRATLAPTRATIRPTLPPRRVENSVESEESDEDDEDYDEDDAPRSNSRNKPEYDDEDDDYSDEDDEPEPPPPPPPPKKKPKKIYYRKRPTIEEYDSIETVDPRRPVTVVVERIKTIKSRPVHKEYAGETVTRPHVKVTKHKSRPHRHHHQRHRRPHLKIIQAADGTQYYVSGKVHNPRKPNIILYEPAPQTVAAPPPAANYSSTNNAPNLVLTGSQFVNHPGKLKWLSQLDNSRRGTPKPTIIYQQIIPAVGLTEPFVNNVQPVYAPRHVYTNPRGAQIPIILGNSSSGQTGSNQYLISPVATRPHENYVQVVPQASHSIGNNLPNDGYYAIVDSKGRLKPAQLVLTKPKSEKLYDVIETRRPPKVPISNIEVYRCDWSKCQLPNCFCGTNVVVPGNLKVSEIPQIILLTFDDSVNAVNYPFYHTFLGTRKNPNGCPVSATFFVSHEWTDYSKVQNLYSQGHEMASHSLSHADGARFTYQKWEDEILGQKEVLMSLGGVQGGDIQGMRAPFLQPGGDNQFIMLQMRNFTYDSSLPVRRTDPPIWPYTLDYGIPHECNIPPCPKARFPSLWEVPLVMWSDLTGGRCSMADACTTPSKTDDIYQMLMSNFEHHYHSNRAPFPMYYHYAWFTKSQNLEAFTTFIDTVLQLEDVYLVTVSQMIEWMRHPTPLSKIKQFAPWQCSNETQKVAPCVKSKTCSYKLENGKERYARTCQQCPPKESRIKFLKK